MCQMFAWMTNPEFIAQAAHALTGYGVALTAAYFGWSLWLAAALFVAYAALKEFWFDLNFETPKQTIWDSMLDFTFYLVGLAIGLGVVQWP